MAIISSLLAGGAEIAPDAGIKGILFRTIGSMVEKGVQTLMHDAETQIPTVKNLISQRNANCKKCYYANRSQ